MKVLLLGDFSTFHVNLAHGLRALGAYVDIISSGDGLKKTEHNISIPNEKNDQIKFFNLLARNIQQYDVVQLMSDSAISTSAFRTLSFLRLVKSKTAVYLVGAGCDHRLWTVGRSKLNIPLFAEIEKYSEPGAKNNIKHYLRNKIVLHYVKGIIAFNEYYEAYLDHKKCLLPVVPAIDIDSIKYVEMNWYSRPIIIFHGLQSGRKAFKGSYSIESAFEKLSQKYPKDVLCICKGDMSYQEYQAHLSRAHIVVDQTNCIGYGMNALISMAMGKVVFCGSQDDFFCNKWLAALNINERPPIFPLAPNDEYIVHQIERMIFDREKLRKISLTSRLYIEKYHNSLVVAKLFLRRWGLNFGADL